MGTPPVAITRRDFAISHMPAMVAAASGVALGGFPGAPSWAGLPQAENDASCAGTILGTAGAAHKHFSANYAEARNKFYTACADTRAVQRSYENPLPGPDGLRLTSDVARFGPAGAKKLLILISGVHGFEGLAGSGCQTNWIAEGLHNDLPEGVAVLIIHAINCYGVAHVTYATEGNVDLNQNFLDFDAELPANPGYEEIHAALNCPELAGPLRDEANAFLAEYRATKGERAFFKALWLGQHTHPDGISFSGTEPTWSHLTTLEILGEFAVDVEHVCVLDTHTGAGTYGRGTVLSTAEAGEVALDRARRWFGPSLQTPWAIKNEESSLVPPFPKPAGYMHTGFVKALPHADVVGTTIELETFDNAQLMQAWLANRWLTFYGDLESDQGREIRRKILASFYPGTEDWTGMIWPRWKQVVTQAICGLGSL